MNYEQLLADIRAAIRPNGEGEITGQLMQDVLVRIAEDLASCYTYGGVIGITTTPDTDKPHTFFLLGEVGIYPNLGDIEHEGGIGIALWDGVSWDYENVPSSAVIETDAIPTAGSTNPVQSGGVQHELALGAIYDVSAKNPTAGPNNDGKFESLSALLSDANLNTLIPTAVRKGGMSVKFVQTPDNKYVQYRLKSNTFSTDTEDWEDESTEVQFHVMVEALAYLYNENKALHELLTGKDNAVLPYIKAQTIECVDKMTMGVPDVLESNVAGAPSAANVPDNWNEATMNVWDGCPRRIGQQYVDKASGKVYYAIKVTGSTANWVALN